MEGMGVDIERGRRVEKVGMREKEVEIDGRVYDHVFMCVPL